MTITTLGAQPLIIIGAGRSGTNMLRDVITRLDGVETWPCDEINYIWRHGNRAHKTDEFTTDMATPSVQKFIRGRFADFVAKSSLSQDGADRQYVLEKTCANSLRVNFVDAVVPEARYIHLIRDGRDVVSSAMHRWKAPLDIGYLAAKAKYVPKSDLAYYASRYFMNRLAKLKDPESSLAVWGPIFASMDELARTQPLEVVCATQWSRCVEASLKAFAGMAENKYIEIRYEDFVVNPVASLVNVSNRLDLGFSEEEFKQACSIVRTDSVGKGRRDAEAPSAAVMNAMKDTLGRCGYEV